MRHRWGFVADACFACFSVTAGIWLLLRLETLVGVPLFDSKMLSSIVVFCSQPAPPSPKTFLVSTAYAFAAGLALHAAPSAGIFVETKDIAALAGGVHLLLSKLTTHSFSSTVGISATVGAMPSDGSWTLPIRFLVTPWLSGHAILYAFALCAQYPRRALRIYLAKRDVQSIIVEAFGSGLATDRNQLRKLFDAYDTSGDGRIDASEFKIAYRKLSKHDLPMADCERIIRTYDVDGNGSIDFEEFCQAIEYHFKHSRSGSWSDVKKAK